jgi:hypothetical protein
MAHIDRISALRKAWREYGTRRASGWVLTVEPIEARDCGEIDRCLPGVGCGDALRSVCRAKHHPSKSLLDKRFANIEKLEEER